MNTDVRRLTAREAFKNGIRWAFGWRQAVKKYIFGSEVGPRTILAGPGRGVRIVADAVRDAAKLLGLYEAELAGHFKKFAMRSNTFYDIGASDGLYSLMFRKVRPSQNIIAVDPDPETRRRIAQNFAINGFTIDARIKIIQDKVGCGAVSIDDNIGMCESPVLIKMDIEGDEYVALQSGSRLFREMECFFIVETHGEELERQCIEFLHALGYHARIVEEAWWRLFVPEDRHIVHNRWFIASRLRKTG
jgi:hypothetical protein